MKHTSHIIFRFTREF